MSEQTALILASLSHRWFPLVLALPVLFGVVAYGARLYRIRVQASPENRVAHRFAGLLRVVSVLLLTVSGIVAVAALFHVGCAAIATNSAQCLSQVKQIAMGMLLYSEDYDQQLPPTSAWAERIDPYVAYAAKMNLSPRRPAADPFQCPSAFTSPASYGMNAALNRQKQSDIASPMETVLFFDAAASTRSFAGGPDDVARTRHNGAPNVAFTDGHARYANEYVLGNLRWDSR